jgi:hypothetical protein
MKHAVALILAICSPLGLGVELSITNNCPQEVWMATMPNFGVADLPDGTVYLNVGAEYTYRCDQLQRMTLRFF